MSYQPLARKYRPQTFSDLMGQDSVAKALTNAIKLGREPHAVIFAGIRGIGKTTTARLYAKALNCQQGPTPEPCGTCSSCEAIELGQHEDVLEIDGASNTGVDDVRALRETVNYIPQRSKFRIFLIDEVHMLSQSAFNALLKTLEEPPAHVVFIFATTEMQKIPKTILSRCQLLQLQKFSVADIAARVRSILTLEGVKFDDAAIAWIAREGHGSMRDALTCLDQVIALGDGVVSLNAIESVLGAAPQELYFTLLQSLITKDQQQFIAVVRDFETHALVFSNIVEQLALYSRDLFVLRNATSDAELITTEVDEPARLRLLELAQMGQPMDWHRIFRWLNQCRGDLDGSTLDRYVFENYGMEWCLDPGFPMVDQLLYNNTATIPDRRAGATAQATRPSPVPPTQPTVARERLANLRADLKQSVVPASTPEPAKDIVPPPPAAVSAPKSFPPTWRQLVDQWKQLKPMQARILEEVYLLRYSPSEIALAVNPDSLAAAKLLQPSIRAKVKDAFKEMFDFAGELHVELKEAEADGHNDVTSNLLDDKRREKDADRERLIAEAKSHPLTQGIIETFGATIQDIVIE